MKKALKIFVPVICVFALAAVVLGILFGSQFSTVASMKKVNSGIYQVNYKADYKLEDILDADVSSVDEFKSWLSDNIFFGFPVDADFSNFACSAFIAHTPDGDCIMGRNYDYVKTDTLLVFTAPKGGYESYAVSDLHIMGVGENSIASADSAYAKIASLASPYTITEGLNEKGLAVAILELKNDEIHQDNGKPDMLLFVAVRMLLDKAANIDEAVTLLESYDIHTFFGSSFHLFIGDSSGESVVVEWIDGKMNVIDADYATNFQLTEGEGYGKGAGQQRYETIEKKFAQTKGVLTEAEAMVLLSQVKIDRSKPWGTEWSVVMNLTDFTLDVCIDTDYENVYKFTKESFR